MPAEPAAVALYLAEQAEHLHISTLQRRLVSIAKAHRCEGLEPPTKDPKVRAVLAGIRREKGSAQKSKAPLRIGLLREVLRQLPKGPRGLRDRAVLLLGFAGAFRRSELVGLDVEDCESSEHGMTITLRRSKTDPEGRSRRIGVPFGKRRTTCPVRALDAWVSSAAIDSGPLFRRMRRHGLVTTERLSAQSVALIVKEAVRAAGLDARRYAGHSLRSGLASSAAEAGASERSIMAQTGHSSVQMVRRYIQSGSLYRDNAAAKAGL